MNVPPDILIEVRRWTEKAEHDLLAAEHTMTLAHKGLTDIICYHCQQAAEKYLKALLLAHGIEFPRTHDLRLLLDLAHQHTPLDADSRSVLPLNRYVIEARYPGDWDPIITQEAAEAITLAQSLCRKIGLLLPSVNTDKKQR